MMDTVQSIIIQYYMVKHERFTTKEKLISEEFVLRWVAVLYFSRLYWPCGGLTGRVRDRTVTLQGIDKKYRVEPGA